MTIYAVEGDLFDNKYQVKALAQGCNSQGVMGAGIAKEFKKRWPEMYQVYRSKCAKGLLIPGDCHPWPIPYVSDNVSFQIGFNLITQDKPGRNAEYHYLTDSLIALLDYLNLFTLKSVAMPAIGCGIGGLEWIRVQEIIQKVFHTWPGSVYVYKPHERRK